MTNARTFTESNSHWYYKDGKPCYELPKKDGSGMKSPTLADAKKLGLLPSVTKIIGILDKPALNDWKVEQGVLAVLTSKQNDGESMDEFVHRVLHVERVQDEESKRAREVGSQIHDAIDKALKGEDWDKSLEAFVNPVIQWVMDNGEVLWSEKILVGNGYAGKADANIRNRLMRGQTLVDFKTCSKLPDKESYPEHKLQTAAYAAAHGNTGDDLLVTANVYISTKQPGDIAVHTQADWQETFRFGFMPLLQYWQWSNKCLTVK